MEFLNDKINTKSEAKSFINNLFNEDKLFHFDDDPREIIDITGTSIFTEKECLLLDERLNEMFLTGFDCYAYALKLIINK
jgi:hypothetical protein